MAESLKILRWGLSGKRVVRPMVVEPVGEGIDEGLQLIDSMRQIVGCIELMPPGRLGPFDAAVEVGALLRLARRDCWMSRTFKVSPRWRSPMEAVH